MVDLITQCQCACDDLIDVTGRAAIQAVLRLSAEEVAGGPPQQGKRRNGDVVFYGQQPGMVMLSDRKLQVKRPRLRQKGPGPDKKRWKSPPTRRCKINRGRAPACWTS